MTEFQNVGKLCPLCKKGIIRYRKVSESGFLEGTDTVEDVFCSNDDCASNK